MLPLYLNTTTLQQFAKASVFLIEIHVSLLLLQKIKNMSHKRYIFEDIFIKRKGVANTCRFFYVLYNIMSFCSFCCCLRGIALYQTARYSYMYI